MFQLAESTKKSIVNSINWEEFNKNPFINTCWSPYLAVHAKIKGKVGETYVTQTLLQNGYDVRPRVNSDHDFILDNKKFEVKFSLASKGEPDTFTWNHVGIQKDWDILLTVGINLEIPDRWLWVTKKDFTNFWGEAWSYQQGGQKAMNDDFCLLGSIKKYMSLDLVNNFDDW